MSNRHIQPPSDHKSHIRNHHEPPSDIINLHTYIVTDWNLECRTPSGRAVLKNVAAGAKS